MPRYLYVESDGQLFLVRRGGKLALPTADEVPFAVEERVPLNFADADVTFATPEDNAFRADWLSKDAVPGLADVDPLVHRAVNATLVREVTGAMIVDAAAVADRDAPLFLRGRDDMLLVKANRGFTKGMWNVPGGFVVYGEAPEDGVVREVKEEVRLDITVERLVGVYTRRFQSPYFMRAHVYLCRAETREVDPDPDEIAEAAWMRLDDVARLTRNPFALEALDAVRCR